MTEAGTISHTMTGQTRGLWYNGVELGESGISAAHAGRFGVNPGIHFAVHFLAYRPEIAQFAMVSRDKFSIGHSGIREQLAHHFPQMRCEAQGAEADPGYIPGIYGGKNFFDGLPVFGFRYDPLLFQYILDGPCSCQLRVRRCNREDEGENTMNLPHTAAPTASNGWPRRYIIVYTTIDSKV